MKSKNLSIEMVKFWKFPEDYPKNMETIDDFYDYHKIKIGIRTDFGTMAMINKANKIMDNVNKKLSEGKLTTKKDIKEYLKLY